MGLKIYQPSNIHPSAKIGDGTKIGAFVDIGRDVVLGKNCNIQAHVTISNECKLGDNVFIGPNTSLLNDKYPVSDVCSPVIVEDNAVIGGGCIILPNVRIGESANIGAGSVVVHDVSSNCLVYGNPAAWRGESITIYKPQTFMYCSNCDYIKVPKGTLNCPICERKLTKTVEKDEGGLPK
ncbi:dTDP-3-amino-3,6-dideoxy-alpha-D-galactopyranose 3-N-acetyltransferase [archaeon BMS3Bbin16]|nr:dTDP-3-amino-3,6-dideoxy-alpha-D-galactopyranose 3-N-acetyltransferase [archaeon BMS3Bbin16]